MPVSRLTRASFDWGVGLKVQTSLAGHGDTGMTSTVNICLGTNKTPGAALPESSLRIFVPLSQIPMNLKVITGRCSMAMKVTSRAVLFIILICKRKFVG
jgi:hypothetical protein